MVRVENVSKVYRAGDEQVRALDGVTLEVARGEFAAVQGPSGCGKTTLLLAVGGLLQPDADSFAWMARMCTRCRLRRARSSGPKRSGSSFQFHLVPYLTVRDNVLAPTLAMSRGDALERAGQLLDRFNLASRAGHKPGELSTGERQRVALARAMLHEPHIILADEPTGNLDEDNADRVLDALADFAGDGGTVLLVTHDSAAASRADRIVRIDAGRLTDEGRRSGRRDVPTAG